MPFCRGHVVERLLEEGGVVVSGVDGRVIFTHKVVAKDGVHILTIVLHISAASISD